MKFDVDKNHALLLLVDIQPDFMPGGALPVDGGDHVIEPLKRLMESGIFRRMAATQDWHPEGHVSFASSHKNRKPMDSIDLYGRPQTLWPDHCIQGTAGAQLHPDLPWKKVDAIIRKGTDPDCDSYSGFRNNWNSTGERLPTGLAGYLRELGLRDIFLCGLARDVCVRWTAEDAADEGFRVVFLWDLTRSVDPSQDNRMESDLRSKEVQVISSERLME